MKVIKIVEPPWQISSPFSTLSCTNGKRFVWWSRRWEIPPSCFGKDTFRAYGASTYVGRNKSKEPKKLSIQYGIKPSMFLSFPSLGDSKMCCCRTASCLITIGHNTFLFGCVETVNADFKRAIRTDERFSFTFRVFNVFQHLYLVCIYTVLHCIPLYRGHVFWVRIGHTVHRIQPRC